MLTTGIIQILSLLCFFLSSTSALKLQDVLRIFNVTNDADPGTCLPFLDDLPALFEEAFWLAEKGLDASNAIANKDVRITKDSAFLFQSLWGLEPLGVRKVAKLAQDKQEL